LGYLLDEQNIERLFLQRFRKAIKANQLTLYFAASGQAALEFLEEHGWSDIMILSDVNMPNMSGLELLKRIKKNYPSIQVFMLTAYSDEKNRQQANIYGADGYLTKPLDFKLLKAQLNLPT